MKIRCTNCGADVPIEQRTAQVVCPYCGTALFAELSKGVPHLMLMNHVEPRNIAPRLQKYLASFEITQSIEVDSHTVTYLPYWRLKSKGKGDHYLLCATNPPALDLEELREPAGEAVSVLENQGSLRLPEPEMLIDEAIAQAGVRGLAVDEDDSHAALVHVPILRVLFSLGGVQYEAAMEGVQGEIFCDGPPPSPQGEKSRALGLIALVSFLFFFAQVYRLDSGWLLLSFPISGWLFYRLVWRLLQKMGW